jgi:hypothetical protein
MPGFRPKNTKRIVMTSKDAATLDGKHEERRAQFEEDREHRIPALVSEKRHLKQLLRDGDACIERRLEVKDRLNAVKKQIRGLRNSEKNYYLQNSKYIFEYFESKKEIAAGGSKPTVLDGFFNLDSRSETRKARNQSMVHRYLAGIDEEFITVDDYVVQTDVCRVCHKGEMVPVEQDGVAVCTECGRSVRCLIECEKPSYKEPPKEVCFYAYKRINHFREILAQFQAKETTQIPDAVLQSIRQQIKRERLDLNQLTNKKAKEILKRLGHNKYYEHIPFIKDKLGIKPPIMSPELEDRLCNLFMDIQGPYAKYCPEDRVNFLNYYYTVYKLCELLDQAQFLPYFPMLKDREKRIEQDEIWKKICAELDWEFIPTV